MKAVVDYHMHTPLCGHAYGDPSEYVEQGIKVGLKEMGFSDHAPFVHCVDPTITMGRDQLPDYHKMIEDVRAEFKDQIKIKVALEADYIPGYEDQTREIIEAYPYDYIIGSVHFIKDWGFDDPAQRDQWDQHDIDKVYQDYFKLLQQSALSGMFDIIGHPDLPKKFGHRPTLNMLDFVAETAEIFYDTGVAIEINTAGWRKPCEEQYPALDHLKIYADAGVMLTFGSDAHRPADVGRDFDKAYKLAKEAGFKEYLIFDQRQIVQTMAIS